jgi:hypothetical protein
VVTDFGIAKVANTEGLTGTGAAVGTPSYMSPEQCHASPLTGSSDQYSLGVMAYEMLTGHLPFDGGNAMSIMFKHVNEPPAPILPRSDCPRNSPLVERMLGQDPSRSFSPMEELVRALAPHDGTRRSGARQLIQYAMEENRNSSASALHEPDSDRHLTRPNSACPAGHGAPCGGPATAGPQRSMAMLGGWPGRRDGRCAGHLPAVGGEPPAVYRLAGLDRIETPPRPPRRPCRSTRRRFSRTDRGEGAAPEPVPISAASGPAATTRQAPQHQPYATRHHPDRPGDRPCVARHW